MKLGIVESALGPGDERTRFARAARAGLAGVEALWTAEASGEARVRRLRRAQAEFGLAIPSLMLAGHNRGGIASGDPAVAARAREEVRAAIAAAGELGARILLVPFFFAGELRTADDLARAAEAFAALCPEAERAGVRLAYEGTLPAEEVQALAARVGSPAFACYFDVANAVWLGLDTAAEARALGDLIAQVHLKDTRVGPGDCRLGLGRVDWAETARALREIGYDGWLVLETPPGPPELVAREASFARRMFPELGDVPWPKLGIFSYGFGRGEEGRLAEVCRSLGLDAVQLGGELLEEALGSDRRREAISRTLGEAGVAICALAGYRNLVAPDPARRREHLEVLTRCLEVAPELGTSVVATETGTCHPESDWQSSPENRSEATWELLVAGVEELVRVAERSFSVLAVEGYVNNVVRTYGQLLGLLERVRSPHLQVVLDPYNYLSRPLLKAKERAVAEFLTRFEPYFVLAHAKDVGPEGAEESTPEFGTGVFPQTIYLNFLMTQRRDLPLVVEHLPLEHVGQVVVRIANSA